MFFDRVRSYLHWLYNYRSIRLTPDGTRFVLLSLAVGVAAINTGNNLLYLLLAMMLSLIVISGMLSEQCLKHLDIRRRAPEHLFANRPATAGIVMTNRKRRFPTFSLRVVDLVGKRSVDRGIHVLHLPPGASILRTYPLLVPRRGIHRLDGVKLLTPFPFGLFMKAASVPLPAELIVYPEPAPLPDLLIQELVARGHERAIPQRGPGAALYNLRTYQAGDDSRAIHWKTSARQGRLTVKETEAEDLRRVTILLPTELSEPIPSAEHRTVQDEKFERAVSQAAALVTVFHERGYAVRLVVGDTEVPYGSGTAHYHRVLRELALCGWRTVGPGASLPEAFRTVERSLDGYVLLVLPWKDRRLSPLRPLVSRVFEAGTMAEDSMATMTERHGS